MIKTRIDIDRIDTRYEHGYYNGVYAAFDIQLIRVNSGYVIDKGVPSLDALPEDVRQALRAWLGTEESDGEEESH